MNNRLNYELSSIKAKSEKKLLSFCPITGIILELEIPSCLAILEFKNPLADLKNILNLVSSTKDLEDLPIEIIAGMTLGLLKKKRLLAEAADTKLSAVEENLLLAAVNRVTLIDLITLVSRITKEQSISLPRLSLESQLLEAESKTFNLNLVVINFIRIIKSSLFGELYLDASRTTVLTSFNVNSTNPKTKAKSAITIELKTELKELVDELIEEQIASDKVIKILKLALTGSNLLSLLNSEGIGTKLIAVLNTYDSLVATELADKLTKISKELTSNDKAEQLFTKDLDRVSDLALSKPKKTIKELLAEKLNRTKPVTATDEEVEALERILDSGEETTDSNEAEEKDTSNEL